MLNRQVVLRFIKVATPSTLLSAGFMVAAVSLANYFDARLHIHSLLPVTLAAAACTGALVYRLSWAHRIKDARAESVIASGYYQTLRIRNALVMLQHINETCDHATADGHANCRSATSQQIKLIKSILGQGPNPELIRGGKMVTSMYSDPRPPAEDTPLLRPGMGLPVVSEGEFSVLPERRAGGDRRYSSLGYYLGHGDSGDDYDA